MIIKDYFLLKIFKRIPSHIKNSGQVFLLRIIGMILSYLVMIYISNIYGAEVFGRYSLSVTLWQFLILIFSLGLPQAILKLTADISHYYKEPISNYLTQSAKLLFFSGIICSVLIFFLKDWLAIVLFNDSNLIPYFKYLSFFLSFGICHTFLTEFIRGKQRFIQYGLFIYVLPYVLLFVFLFLFKKLEFKESSTFLSFLMGFSVLCFIMLIYFPREKAVKDYPYNKLLSLSFPMLLSAAFIFISNWTDVFMLGAMVSKKEVGIYNAAYKLATVALVVINAVNTVLAPKISELYSKNKIEEIQDEVQKATKLITLTTVPIVIVLIFFRSFLLGLFGDDFKEEGQPVLIVVSLGLLFNALSGSIAQVLNMTKHQKELRAFTIISAVCNVVLNYFLISRQGILGAAIASLISNIVLNLLGIIYIKKKFNFYTFFWS